MEKINFSIDGPILFHNDIFNDDRGFLRETYSIIKYRDVVPEQWVQTNHSFSFEGVIRGLHYQNDEAKLISVISGKIFDVAVDLRRDSQTFGKWVCATLDEGSQMYIPGDFAHGFLAIKNSHVVYQTSKSWNPKLAGGIAWNDPDLNIDWIIKDPILSEKDKKNQSFKDYVKNLDSR